MAASCKRLAWVNSKASDCTMPVDAHRFMEFIFGHIEFNTTFGTIGHEVDGQIVQVGNNIKLGVMRRLRMRDIGIIIITCVLFVLAFLTNLFVPNGTAEVIAAQ